MNRRIIAAWTAALAVVSPGALAATWHVSPDGSDDGPGDSARPFRTIQRAADGAGPGDTVIVHDGTYIDEDGDNMVVHVNRAGTETDWITFRAENRWGALVDGQDFATGYCWDFGGGAAYILVEGMEIARFFSGGFWSNAGAHHITMEGNHVHAIGNVETSSEYGICGAFEGSEASYHVYDGNVFHDIGRTGPPDQNFNHDHAIYNCGDHATIVNNLFYDCNAGWGVHMAGYDTVDDVLVSNNLFAYGYVRGQIILWQPCHNVTIQNNIFYMPAVENAINFLTDDLENIVIRNNLVFGGGLKDADDLGVPVLSGNIEGTDPLLVDPEAYDFHLLDGSPAIDAGFADLSPDHDLEGNPRPQEGGFDIGAYEHPAPPPEGEDMEETADEAAETPGDIAPPDEAVEASDGWPDVQADHAEAPQDVGGLEEEPERESSGCGCSVGAR
jgi:hypothetical protein